ncbi:MAG TPA: MerR family transcriptional regulator [Vicinamibacterales bacterium]|nr:MerR family transcriptional regulator [Vicinamibacterales bacterium]
MRLKKTYSSREVAALTGLTARQLQWWDVHRLVLSAVAPRRTAAGGFTERRYSPVDLLELAVLADLRRRGFSAGKIRRLIETLRERFGVRLFEATSGGGEVTLLTDGREIYARTRAGEFFNLLRAPAQPLLEIGEETVLRELNGRMRGRRKRVAAKPRATGRSDSAD